MAEKAVIVISKDAPLVSSLRTDLEKSDTRVISAQDFPSLLKMIQASQAELIILDGFGQPGSLEMCRTLSEKFPIALLVLMNGKDGEQPGGGAIEYIAKPVNTAELRTQVDSILKQSEARNAPDKDEHITVNNLSIDIPSHEVKVGDTRLELTSKEFDLLIVLARNRGRIISRRKLVEQAWGKSELGKSRTVDTHICRLRKKLEPDAVWPTRLLTVRGFGYKLER